MKQNQISKVLPRSVWDSVFIHENNELLVEIRETKKLKVGGIHKVYEPLFFVRKTIAEKLYAVSNNLPQGILMVVIEGYRSMQHQQDSWGIVVSKNYDKITWIGVMRILKNKFALWWQSLTHSQTIIAVELLM